MRNVALALLAAGGLAMVGSAPAEAVGTRYPFASRAMNFRASATAPLRATSCVRPPLRGGFSTASSARQSRPSGTVGLPLALISKAAIRDSAPA
jgi:hypothetical protein